MGPFKNNPFNYTRGRKCVSLRVQALIRARITYLPNVFNSRAKGFLNEESSYILARIFHTQVSEKRTRERNEYGEEIK